MRAELSLRLNTTTLRPLPSYTSRERLALALQRAVATCRSPSKELARRLHRTQRSAEQLLRGDAAPSFETLIEACRHFDEVWEEMRELCGRAHERSDAEQLLEEFAARLRDRQR